MSTVDRAPGMCVETQRENLNDDYLITPNDLFRGTGAYKGLTPHARLFLGAGLSCANRWRTTLEEIEEWLPDLGRARHEALRRELRERGFLTMRRGRIPAGEPNGGRYMWTFKFFMRPLPEADRDELPVKTPKEKKPRPLPPAAARALERRAEAAGETAGQTTPSELGLGDDPDDDPEETAGRTTPWGEGHGRQGHGEPGPGYQGDVKEEKNHSEKNQEDPPLPLGDQLTTAREDDPPDGSAPSGSGSEGGEKSPRFDEQTKAILGAAVRRVLELRPGWRQDEVRDAMLAEIDAGRPPGVVASAVVQLAEDRQTEGPGRLKKPGPWWNPPVPPPTVRVLDSGAPQCRKHRGEPEGHCGRCRADGLAEVDDADAPVDVPLTAAERRKLIAAKIEAGRSKIDASARTKPTRIPTSRSRSEDPSPEGPVVAAVEPVRAFELALR